MISIYFNCSKTFLEKVKKEMGNGFEILSKNSDLRGVKIDFVFIEYEFESSLYFESSEKSVEVVFSTNEKFLPGVIYIPPEEPGIGIKNLINYTLAARKNLPVKRKTDCPDSKRFDLLSRSIFNWSNDIEIEKFLKNILYDEIKLINGAYGGSVWIKEKKHFNCSASIGLDEKLLKKLKLKESEVFKSPTDEAVVVISKKYNSGLNEQKKELIKQLGTFEKHTTLVGNISVGGKLYGNICLDGRFGKDTFNQEDINIHSFYSRIVSKFIEERLMRQKTKDLMKKLMESEKKFRSVSENTNSFIFILQNSKIVYSNPSIKAILEGDSKIEKALIRKTIGSLKNRFEKETRGKFEIKVTGKSVRWFKFDFSVVTFDGKEALLCHGNEITETKTAYEKIKYMALHDPLTDLYNRSYFEEEILRLKTPRSFPVSLLMGDLNNMKITNDTFGHDQGDELIKNTANVLRNSFRSCDVVARIGGDEFAVILPKTDEEVLKNIYLRLVKEIENFNSQSDLKIDISIGYATQQKNESIRKVSKRADSKMYEIKRLAKKSSINQDY